MRKLKDLIKELQELVEKYPESAEYQIVYAHDDEGNEYQRVINEPSLCQLENPKQDYYRNLEMVGFYNNEKNDIALEDCNAVIIN